MTFTKQLKDFKDLRQGTGWCVIAHSPFMSQLWSEVLFLNSTYKFCEKSQECKLSEDTFKSGRKQLSDFLVPWVWRWISRCEQCWIICAFFLFLNHKTQSSGMNTFGLLCTRLNTQTYGTAKKKKASLPACFWMVDIFSHGFLHKYTKMKTLT